MHSTTMVPAGPRERLVEVGVDALGDAELVALLLGTGHSTESALVVATRMLADHGGLTGLARAGVGEFASRRGIGTAKGARVAAARDQSPHDDQPLERAERHIRGGQGEDAEKGQPSDAFERLFNARGG